MLQILNKKQKMNHIEVSNEEDPDPSIFFGYWLFFSRIVQKHTPTDPKDKFFSALSELTSSIVTLLFEKNKYRHNEQKMMEIAGSSYFLRKISIDTTSKK